MADKEQRHECGEDEIACDGKGFSHRKETISVEEETDIDSSLSKTETNQVLANHYGFTDEELDFIINYDIKYRLGQDDGAEAEE